MARAVPRRPRRRQVRRQRHGRRRPQGRLRPGRRLPAVCRAAPRRRPRRRPADRRDARPARPEQRVPRRAAGHDARGHGRRPHGAHRPGRARARRPAQPARPGRRRAVRRGRRACSAPGAAAPTSTARTVDLGLVGDVETVNPGRPCRTSSTPGGSRSSPPSRPTSTTTGQVLNVNADTAAAALAVALGAHKLVMLTDVEGIYADWPDRDSLLSSLSGQRARASCCRRRRRA